MSKLTNLMYAALLASGDNYLQCALDTKIELKSKGLAECIVEGNEKTERSKYQAISIIRHHIAESLKNQYLTVEDPLELWLELKNRYDHQRTIQLPKAQHDWLNLRIQDYKSVEEYNSELFKIVSILRLCGEKVTENDMLEKTFSTFHANNVLLQQQYRAKGFTTYTSLASCLLLAEKNNELLLMNSALRPPGSTAVPEANRAEMAKAPNEPQATKESNYVHRGNPHGRGRGRGRGGRGRGNFYGQGNHYGGRGRGNYGRSRGRGRGINKPRGKAKSVCYRCGMDDHWAKTCRTSKHLIEAYQEMIKQKGPEANLVHLDGEGDFDHEKDDLMDYETSDILGKYTSSFKFALFALLCSLISIARCLGFIYFNGIALLHYCLLYRLRYSSCPHLEMAEDKDILIVDSGSSHTILRDKRYFINLTLRNANISTIAGIASLIEGYGQAHVLLPNGTHLEISDALYSPSSKRSLLSFKDIRLNGFHVETKGEGNREFLHITEIAQGHKRVLETIPALSTGLYHTKINMIEANLAMNKEFIEEFTLWHDRLDHPGHNMMRKLMISSKGHTLKEKRVIPKKLTCAACAQGKLIVRPSPAKVNKETINFLERIQGDICGPIHPPCGTFRYFMVLIDASTRWSHVCLLSSRNQAFARLLAQIIRLRAHFPDFPLKTIRLDNAGEFTSQAFNN